MHVLFFSAQYLPTVGGVERYTDSLCRTLIKKGHHATVVTSALPNLAEEEIKDGIRIIRLPSHRLLGGRFPVVKNAAFAKLLSRVMDDPPDLAVIQTRFYPLSLCAAVLLGQTRTPTIVIEHGSRHLTLSPVLDPLVRLYEHAAAARIKRFDFPFYAVSAAASRWLAHFRIRSAGTIYNAVDPKEVRRTADSSNFHIRKRFSLPKDSRIVLFSGRLVPEKGLPELLTAFSAIQKQRSDTFLVIAGDGRLRKQIEQGKPKQVLLTGMLSYRDSLALMQEADLLILPSYSEGFSTVVLEAAALGLPIITTPTGGSEELLLRTRSSILLEEITPTAIAEALHRMLDDSSFRDAAVNETVKRLEQSFTWEQTADRLIEIANNM